ncbi:Carboxylate/Amino Acid/Amine Transporter [Candidatus Regiella insecticola 5.15]|uniref:Carboxylate/Amino Acid/Amine Transporter n=1 Tax=Candidatus Regiella insecticola 5.15 TaxID=1005043 RepID=G2H0P0_9ENTR|nr:carboxylate/amino acid/amine transporter [Candidatus Regiella insecticola]EGY28442.1 Carboxylate/Amino Acid/Amine Transporter [Candidatus Regiella insecticola 5.15]
MLLLIITTVIWAFSFSLIGEYLAGQVDSWFSALIRVSLATLVFLPFLRWRMLNLRIIFLYMTVGAIQLGFMYLFSFRAYLYLSVAEFLLFTVMTPLYVTLIHDLLKRQPLKWGYASSAVLAVLGALVIRYDRLHEDFWFGLLLVQAANICFAIGQVGYKRLMEIHPIPQHNAFAWFYLGALIVTLVAWCAFGNLEKLPTTTMEWGILAWLGIIASGLGYFMWNYGATQTDAGTLGIMNNLHIPAGLLVNFVLWQAQPDWTRFIIGAGLILVSLWVHVRWVIPRP